MKVSEAVILGYTMVKLNPCIFLACGQGCLQGAAYMAATGKDFALIEDIIELWPWLGNEVPDPVTGRPCEASHIINRMAYAVEHRKMTLEQAVDWIRSVEPEEPVVVGQVIDDFIATDGWEKEEV